MRQKTKLFADDSNLLSVIKGPEDSLSLQEDLRRVCDWSKTWGMKLNATKFKMKFLEKRIRVNRTLWKTPLGIVAN